MQAKFHKPSTFVISVYLFCCAHCKLSEANYRSANFRIRLQKIHYLLTSHFFSLSRKFRMPYLMQFYNVCINMWKILSLRLAHTASMWTLLDFIQEELTTFTEAQCFLFRRLEKFRPIYKLKSKHWKISAFLLKQTNVNFKVILYFYIYFKFLSFFVCFKSPPKISKRAFKKILSIITNFILNLSDI